LEILGRLKERFHWLKVIFADSAYGRNNLAECVKGAFGWLLPATASLGRDRPPRWPVRIAQAL
jgi:hypothetical protein